MLGKPVTFLLLFDLICGACPVSKAADVLGEERVGNLRIGMPGAEVKKLVGCALRRGPENSWGVDGAYHQIWRCGSCGLQLGMVSEKRGGPKCIGSITLDSPCTLATRQGIRIGSTEQEVQKAYKAWWNREDSQQNGCFVAGSLFGGIMFRFQGGKVREIFLGAAAE